MGTTFMDVIKGMHKTDYWKEQEERKEREKEERKKRMKDLSLWESMRESSTYGKCDGGMLEFGELNFHGDMKCYKDYCRAYNDDRSLFPEVRVSDDDILKCKAFADELDVEHWRKDRSKEELDIEKVQSDNAIGKIGEFIVRNSLRRIGIETDEPDMKIYDVSKKSFDSDLHAVINGNEVGISIKTFRICGSPVSKVSWVLQWKDEQKVNGKIIIKDSGTDKHFFDFDNKLRDGLWFAGVSISPDRRRGRILAFLPMQQLFDAYPHDKKTLKAYGDMELGKFSNTKRALYWDDMAEKKLLPSDVDLPDCFEFPF